MAEDEIRIRHQQMLSLYDECSALLKNFKKPKGVNMEQKKSIYSELKSKLNDFNTAWDNFKIELASIPHNASNALDVKAQYQKHSVTHRKRLKELKNEIEWAGTSMDRDDMFGGMGDGNMELTNMESVEARKNQHLELLDEGKTSLQRTLAVTNQTIGIGRDVVVKLDEQTEQMEHIFEDLTEMEQLLDRSKRVMTKMIRGLKSDQYLWCLIGLVFFSIVGVIIYEIGWGGTDPVQQKL